MSSTGQPPAKRKCAEDPLEDAALPVIPVKSSIWYHDGNVVLQAEGTQWKVHQGILAESSSIFRDMFSLPQPPSDDAEQVEGCPFVKLSDTAEEVEYVLQAICKREYVGLDEALPLPVISAFIRLGTKYDIHKLRKEGQKRIFNEFPTDLAYMEGVSLANTWVPTWKFVKQPENWLEFVIFARTTGLLSILPFVLHACCQCYSASNIMQGIKRRDGTIVSLSVSDQLACLAGFQAICKAQAETTFSWAYTQERPAGCTCITCIHVRQNFVNRNFTPLPRIHGLGRFDKPVFLRSGLCSICADRSQEMHNTGRKIFWALLPSLFGLPPWEDLLKEREEVE